MGGLKVSVLVPTYNGAEFLEETISSVLNQTYENFELVIVNDASPDDTDAVVSAFTDPRLRYIVHAKNRGAAAARNTAFRASTGDVIAFLDQDDLFHPEKLAAHVQVYESYPDTGMTYNARYELNHSSSTIREIYRLSGPPTQADLVLGYPLSPSDVMLRREWLTRVGLWDESFPFYGCELVLFSRLYMAGCTLAGIDRVLNYRRYLSGRIIGNLSGGCQTELKAQEHILSDPGCPEEIKVLRPIAFANTYRIWAFYAFAQGDSAIGKTLVEEAVRLEPSLLDGNPCELVKFLVYNSVADEHVDHETLLERIFAELPVEMTSLSEQKGWAVGYGYLLKATRAVIWNRLEEGRAHFARATDFGAKIDEDFLANLTHQLLSFETEFGSETMQSVLSNLIPHLQKISTRATVHRLQALLYANQAFHYHRRGEDVTVLRSVIGAIRHRSGYLSNRGILSIAARSGARLLLRVVDPRNWSSHRFHALLESE